MKETTLWNHLRPELARVGKFQKLSDRFTPGVPDVVGCCAGHLGMALELKEFSGVRVLKVGFRPGQVDWLEEWNEAGGTSWIISSHKQTVMVHPVSLSTALENGIDPETARSVAAMYFTKSRTNTWRRFVTELILLKRNP